jgi:hypothetical protein
MERSRAQPQQRKFGEMHVQSPRLRLRENRSGIPTLDGAALEHLAKGIDPLALDPIGKHPSSPRNLGLSYAGLTRVSIQKDSAFRGLNKPLQSVRDDSPRGAHHSLRNQMRNEWCRW